MNKSEQSLAEISYGAMRDLDRLRRNVLEEIEGNVARVRMKLVSKIDEEKTFAERDLAFEGIVHRTFLRTELMDRSQRDLSQFIENVREFIARLDRVTVSTDPEEIKALSKVFDILCKEARCAEMSSGYRGLAAA